MVCENCLKLRKELEDLTFKLSNTESDLDKANDKILLTIIERDLEAKGRAAGLPQDAIKDIRLRSMDLAKEIGGKWGLDETGGPAIMKHGRIARSLDDASELTLDAVYGIVRNKAKHLFAPEAYAGQGIVKNPWLKENENLTEQGRILREKPALAKQMAAAAGVKLAT